MKEFVLPVVVSVVTGVGASFVSSQMAVKVLETKVDYIEADIKTISTLTNTINQVQLEMTRRGQWIVTTDKRLDHQERVMQSIKDSLNRTVIDDS